MPGPRGSSRTSDEQHASRLSEWLRGGPVPRKFGTGLVVAIVLLVAVWSIQPAALAQETDGDRADYCDEEGVEPVPAGNYGEMLSPNDRDVLVTNLSEGDFITVNLTYDGPEGSALAIYGESENISYTGTNGEPVSNISNFGTETRSSSDIYVSGTPNVRGLTVTPGNTQFRVYAEADGFCLAFHTVEADSPTSYPGDSSDGGAGTWRLSFTVNEAETRNIGPTQPPEGSEIDELESRIEDLEQRIEDLERRIAQLENETESSANE